MKKILFTIISAVALCACVKNSDLITIDNDQITFAANIETPESRSVLVEQDGKYHAEWVAGDYVELF